MIYKKENLKQHSGNGFDKIFSINDEVITIAKYHYSIMRNRCRKIFSILTTHDDNFFHSSATCD